MELVFGGLAFCAAMVFAAIMGLAIQRGATCTVAAMEELLIERRPTRLLALGEASFWVAGGLLLAQGLGQLRSVPVSYALSPWTFLGATILALGAVVNRACVFGSIARLGSGDWAYVATPVGFYLGCLTVSRVFGAPQPHALDVGSPLFDAPAWLLWLIAIFGIFRLLGLLLLIARSQLRSVWSPHLATTVIGIAFVSMLLLAGAWAYTDVLAELARGMSGSLLVRVALALALLSGAIAGGYRMALPRVATTLRTVSGCAVGGLLMGWGSLLIPGGNDGLILLGMPLLRPYAWASFAMMCAVVGISLGLLRLVKRK
jgi:hypothetical protein